MHKQTLISVYSPPLSKRHYRCVQLHNEYHVSCCVVDMRKSYLTYEEKSPYPNGRILHERSIDMNIMVIVTANVLFGKFKSYNINDTIALRKCQYMKHWSFQIALCEDPNRNLPPAIKRKYITTWLERRQNV